MSDASGETSMRRVIATPLAILLVINATIGTGIFKTPAKVARAAGSMPVALAVWLAGAVIALCGALSLAELAAAIPRTGGLYEYLRRTYGPTPAFLFGWSKLTVLIPSAVGGFSRLGAEALAALFDLAPNATRDSAVAIVILALCAGVNVLGVRESAIQQGAITSAKYVGVALLAAAGLFASVSLSAAPIALSADTPAFAASPSFTGAFTALVSCMWAYDGWADLSSLSGEVKDPGRTLPRALFVGTLAVGVAYLAANFGYARVLGLDGLRASTTGSHMAASNLAALTLGAAGQRALAALVLVSCVGGCMSSLLTGSRVFVPLATDGLFLRGLGVVSPRTRVPARAVVVCSVLGAFYVSFRSFEQLTDGFVVGYFPFYALAVIAIFVLRRREPELPRPFRVPLYPIVPIVFLLGAAALMIGAAVDADRSALLSFAVVLAGIPVSLLYRQRARARIVPR